MLASNPPNLRGANGSDCLSHTIEVRQEDFEVGTSDLEYHNADRIRRRVSKGREILVNGEQDVELLGGKRQEFAVFRSGPPELLNRPRLKFRQRSNEGPGNALVNE